MDNIFVLQYSEFIVAKELSSFLSKSKGYSILIPTSRQQKGFDLAIYNFKSKKTVTVQVKSSRVYMDKPDKKGTKRQFNTWFNRFDIEKGAADFYALACFYPVNAKRNFKRSKKPTKWYAPLILLFQEREMIAFLRETTKKHSGGIDSSFGFGFDEISAIYINRGATKNKNISQYLFIKQYSKIKKALK